MLLWKLFYYSAIASTAFNPVFSFTDFTITTSTNMISCPTFTSFCDVISMLHHLIHCSLCSVQYLDNVCHCHSVFWNEVKEVEESGDLGFLLPTSVNINSFFIVENSDSHISSPLFPRIILVSCLLWPVSGEVFGEWIFGFLMLAENIINCKLQRENSQTELAGRSFLKVKKRFMHILFGTMYLGFRLPLANI